MSNNRIVAVLNMLLGVDIGTTNMKAVVLNENLEQVYTTRERIEATDPQTWVKAFYSILERVPYNVDAIGLSFMAPVLIPISREGEPLLTILYNDPRVSGYVEKLMEKSMEYWLGITANPPTMQMQLPKILWYRENFPELEKKTEKYLDTGGFLLSKIVEPEKTFIIDESTALEWGIMDVKKRKWSDEILADFNIDSTKLPDIVATTEVVGELRESIGKVKKGTPIVAGTVDFLSGLLGSGINEPNQCFITYGTTSCMGVLSKKLLPSPNLYLDLHPVSNLSVINGCMALSGGVIEWLGRVMCRQMSRFDYKIFSKYPPPKILFYPFLRGERTPFNAPEAKASILGLSHTHTDEDIYYSALIGISLAIKHHFEVFKDMGLRCAELYGLLGKRIKMLPQLVTDVLGKEQFVIYYASEPVGAALLAGIGTKLFSIGWAMNRVKHTSRLKGTLINPRANFGAFLGRLYRIYIKYLNYMLDVSRELEKL